jgi:phosphomannomutase
MLTIFYARSDELKQTFLFLNHLYAFVSLGSDLPKQEEQLGEGIVNVFPYNFSQNGLVAYKNGELLNVQTISQHIGEDNVKRIVNWTLKYIAALDIPIKVRIW